MTSSSPLKQIMAIRRDEMPQTLLMSSYFFLVIATFWILRPLKTGLFIQFYDQRVFNFLAWEFNAAQAQNLAKVGNMIVAIFAATAFVYLSRYFRRQRLTYIFAGFSVICFAILAGFINEPGPRAVWTFYWWGDLYNTLMVASFFAFLNDSVSPSSAKRLYGLVVLGGVAGGAFGSIVLAGWIGALSLGNWMWVCAGLTVIVGVVASLAGKQFEKEDTLVPSANREPDVAKDSTVASTTRLVFGSRYLLAIVAVVGLYEMMSAIMDFQFSSTISYYLDGDAISAQFARVFALTNGVALFVQVFLTGFVMTRFGVGAALLFLPVVALMGSVGFMAAPILWAGSLLNTADNGFAYSINQSGKEALYTPTSKAEKYQAKAFIDMFVVRFAKAVAVGLSLTITTVFAGFESIRWLSLVTIAILLVWITVARFAGREFERMSEETESSASPRLSPNAEPGTAGAK